jgi:hypothetical protein
VGPTEGNSTRNSSGFVGAESGAGGAGCVEVGDGLALDLLVPEIVAGSASKGARCVGVVDGPVWDLLVPDASAGSASDLLPATEVEGDTMAEILYGRAASRRETLTGSICEELGILIDGKSVLFPFDEGSGRRRTSDV